jgi:hypothetical protein
VGQGFGPAAELPLGAPTINLSAADKLNDLDLGAAHDGGAGPHFAFDDRPVQFDRYPLRLQVERPDNIEQRRLRRKAAMFSVNCNLIFRRHDFTWIIIVRGDLPGPLKSSLKNA